MGRLLFALGVAVFLVTEPEEAAYGQISLTLSSSADVSHLAVGEPITFQVNLSGLNVGQELDSLAATIVYNSNLLGAPTISPGDVIPNLVDFLSFEDAGIADATFQTFSVDPLDHILADGEFFSFDVTVLAPGSGSMSLSFVDATAFNEADPLVPIPINSTAGPSLSFTTIVPEPASLILLSIGLVAGALLRFAWR